MKMMFAITIASPMRDHSETVVFAAPLNLMTHDGAGVVMKAQAIRATPIRATGYSFSAISGCTTFDPDEVIVQ
jgi:hypothetical protein